MAVFATPSNPYSYRETLAGCVNGETTYYSIYYCDPLTGPVPGDGVTTDAVSYFYQLDAAGAEVVIDFATGAASFTPGACADAPDFEVGVITDPNDPTAPDIPVTLTIDPVTGLPVYTSLLDGTVIVPTDPQEYRNNTVDFEIVDTFGCIKDATGVTVTNGAQLIVVYNEDATEVSRTLLNAATGAVITLAAGEVFGPCSGGMASELDCGCLVDETNGTVRPAYQEIPRDADTGLVDWAGVAYADTAGAPLVPLATEMFHCGPCPTVIDC